MLSPLHGGLRGVDLRVALGHDLVMSSSPNIGASYEIPGTPEEYTCEWGVRWKWVTNAEGGRYTETVGHPLADAADLTSLQNAGPLGASMQPIYAETRQLVEKYGKTHVVFGSLYQTIFEAAWLLRGMQALLSDMLINKDFAHALFERLMEYSLVAGKEMVAQGIDVLWLGDDFGTQRAMLLSPRTWREFIKERYARLIAAYKGAEPILEDRLSLRWLHRADHPRPDRDRAGYPQSHPAAIHGPGRDQAQIRAAPVLLGNGGRAEYLPLRDSPRC